MNTVAINDSGGSVSGNRSKKDEELSVEVGVRRVFKHLKQRYYILNSFIILGYPLFRYCGVLVKPKNEGMILYISFFMILLKILKKRNLDMVLTGILFNLKLCIGILIYYSTTDSIYQGSMKKCFTYLSIYALTNAIAFVLCPQPRPKNSNHVQYFNQITYKDALHHSMNSKDVKDKFWLMELFTTWSPQCVYLASTFSDLSIKYHRAVNFGKVDISRWKSIAYDHNIDDSVNSKQIPTIILFENGKEIMRLPHRKDEYQKAYDKSKPDDRSFVPSNLTSSEIISYFNLDQLKTNYKKSIKESRNNKKNK
ncbi:hypothetical protein CYY_001471 [Polysphondylium violaceum]|uniref:Thioredoxin domain-containing protein n=1 Tax=Polysphondylium violaceum TaxID=133409 RepID=A0A8J4Q316_9MYCE|nr:hypothetical protein CYY_001471 [Polysphondylium violaceum]